MQVERSIPAALLRNAAGYAILSVLKIGMGWSAAVGTGLVVARRQDGSWSPPSAIGLGSFGWGIQAGGELADLLLVLNDMETVKVCPCGNAALQCVDVAVMPSSRAANTSMPLQAFCGDVHLGVAGNVNVTVGPIGRDACASVCVGKRGCAMVYSYSCSRGAFLGASVDGTVTHTRSNANLAFYGRPVTAKDLLLGGIVEAPPAARTLYSSLDSMMNSFGYCQLHQQPVALQHAAGVGQPMRLPLSSTFSVDDFGCEKADALPEESALATSELPDSMHAAMRPASLQPGLQASSQQLQVPAASSPVQARDPASAGNAAPASVADAASEMSDEVQEFSLFDD